MRWSFPSHPRQRLANVLCKLVGKRFSSFLINLCRIEIKSIHDQLCRVHALSSEVLSKSKLKQKEIKVLDFEKF